LLDSSFTPKPYTMYFLTKHDPNYLIKGSRDPLGFQVIWQNAGRDIIPHLSTVSNTVRDFQILCIAYALKHQLAIPNEEFEGYFMRIEQILGYTRYFFCDDSSFNGVDRVRKRADKARFDISSRPDDQLMSSQKSYGIWGKYIRPFQDSDLPNDQAFMEVYSAKIKENAAFWHLAKDVKAAGADSRYTMTKQKLQACKGVLEKPGATEKALFERRLLNDNYHGQLLELVRKNNGFEGWPPLYALIDALNGGTTDDHFRASLEHIRNTEKVLCPLDRIFRYLQRRSFWTLKAIENDEYIQRWRTRPDIRLLKDPCKDLALLFELPNLQLVEGLVKRNTEVTTLRGSSPWMQFSSDGLEVNHEEGSLFDASYQVESGSNNPYFLYTFISLYKQLN